MNAFTAIGSVFLLLSATQANAQVETTTGAENLNAEELTPRLRRGGVIVVMRHQRAMVEGKWDDFSRPLSDCSAQRNLSPAGYAAAAETGQALRNLNIEFSTVLASPMCRTMESARLIFGQVTPEETLSHISEVRGFDAQAAAEGLIVGMESFKLMGPGNLAIVTHGGNIEAAFGEDLSEGDMLFFERKPEGGILLIGRTAASDFDLIANEEMVERAQRRLNNADA